MGRTVRGKTNTQGRKGHSGKGVATGANLKRKVTGNPSISRRTSGAEKKKPGRRSRGGLAAATGRGLRTRK